MTPRYWPTPAESSPSLSASILREQTLTQQAIVEHARVVSECFRTLTVLPFRFGTIFDSDEALRRAVRANRKTFLETVDRLRGKSEMHFKLLVKDGNLEEAVSELPNGRWWRVSAQVAGAGQRERERQTKARALSMQVHKLFSPLEEDVICKRTDSGSILIDFAHLIESNSVAKYQNRYGTATRHFKDCHVTITGPGLRTTSCQANCARFPAATNGLSRSSDRLVRPERPAKPLFRVPSTSQQIVQTNSRSPVRTCSSWSYNRSTLIRDNLKVSTGS